MLGFGKDRQTSINEVIEGTLKNHKENITRIMKAYENITEMALKNHEKLETFQNDIDDMNERIDDTRKEVFDAIHKINNKLQSIYFSIDELGGLDSLDAIDKGE